jgi:uncharacterized protein
MFNPVLLVAFGVMVGVFSGVMGLGGGSVMIPIMVLVLGLTQTQAHGTSLAVMTVPVMLPAVIHYWRHGNVNLAVAAWVAVGVAMGTFFGAYIANAVPKETLKLIFGLTLIYVAAYTVFGSANLPRTTLLSALLVIVAILMFAATQYMDKRPEREARAAAAAVVVDDSRSAK